MRPNRLYSFVSGNHQFVYKTLNMINDDKVEENPIDTLNDTLFSHSIFPSSGVEWNLLYSVISHQPDDFVCPICLFTPVCPVITECGHIFCLDCLRQHQKLNEPKAPCPVCYDVLDNMKFVRCDLRLYPKDDKQVKFKKVVKNRRNCICFDSSTKASRTQIPNASEQSAKFSHVQIADYPNAKKILETELDSLETQITIYGSPEYDDPPKVSQLKMIQENIRTELDKLKEQFSEDDPPFMLQTFNEDDEIYFYQEESGRLVFLDSLSNEILKCFNSNPKTYPNELNVNILKMTAAPVTRGLKRKYPALGHLPSGADAEFVLADLSDVVGPKIIEMFKERIEERVRIDEDSGAEEEEGKEKAPDLSSAAFPELGPAAPPRMKSAGWAAISPPSASVRREEFPSLGGPPSKAPEKKASPWGKVSSQLREKEREEFPSLGASPTAPPPKRMNSWGNLK